MPQLGESIAEATVLKYLASPGELVQAGQDLIEVETNKAIMSVVSPSKGVIEKFSANVGESYPVTAVLGSLLISDEEARNIRIATDEQLDQFPTSVGSPAEEGVAVADLQVRPTISGLPVPARLTGAGYISPRLKARMTELGLRAADLSGIAGSGAAGRVTVNDFEKYIASLAEQKLTPASSMRIAVADAMSRSWTRPLATVGMPFNLGPLLIHRDAQPNKPGPALYALRALALALSDNSAAAGRLVGSNIVHPSSIDIGFAVEAEGGVLVPVIRSADTKRLQDLVLQYKNLVELARVQKLPADATGGSIATVTNYGTFGLAIATPIPLPEQTILLGMGAGRKVPNWDESLDKFIAITEANLTLSFDHRVIDGGAAGRLLGRVAYLMMNPHGL